MTEPDWNWQHLSGAERERLAARLMHETASRMAGHMAHRIIPVKWGATYVTEFDREFEERVQAAPELAPATAVDRWAHIVLYMALRLREKIKANGEHVLVDVNGIEVQNPF